MINGFSNETAPLTERELEALPAFVSALSRAHGKANAIYNNELQSLAPEMTGERVRKIINHIRRNDLVPCLVASSRGYFVADTEAELIDYEDSLRGRESAIREVRESIERQRRIRFSRVGQQLTLF